jgi:heme-degrading monooxygenase HmoA
VSYHLAQVNVSYSKAPIDDPIMAEFVAKLDEINQLAERSPGFIWRHISDSRDPAQREYDDPLILFNMSVWESIEALRDYTYRTDHAPVFAHRKDWFIDWKENMGYPSYALWWIPAGTLPTVEEAKAKLIRLGEIGPSSEAFTFKSPFATQ